jgi:sarcosine oxidase gamma subunit
VTDPINPLDRLDDIKERWSLDSSLPREAHELAVAVRAHFTNGVGIRVMDSFNASPVSWGLDDVVWLVQEVERLRAEAKRADEEATTANARLIAASPDMWMVCDRLRQWWMEHGIEGNKELDAVVDLARSALAKVEGDVKG